MTRTTPDAGHAAAAERGESIALYTRLLEAWNRRDAHGFASLFADGASVIGFDGSEMNGPAEIDAQLGAIFAHHPTASYVARVREVRELVGGVTLLRADVGMIPPGRSALDPAVNALQSAVVVARAGERTIAHFQNTPAALHGRPQLVERLTAELTDVLRSGRVVDASAANASRAE